MYARNSLGKVSVFREVSSFEGVSLERCPHFMSVFRGVLISRVSLEECPHFMGVLISRVSLERGCVLQQELFTCDSVDIVVVGIETC